MFYNFGMRLTTLCLLICSLWLPVFADRKGEGAQIIRSSVTEIPRPKSKPLAESAISSEVKIVNVRAELIQVEAKKLSGLSQQDLKTLVTFARRNGAQDQLGLAVAVESGKIAKVKSVSEFRHPTAFEDGHVYRSKNDKATYSFAEGQSSPNASTYIIPSSATRFAMTELGYQLEVTPAVTKDGAIKLSGKLSDKSFTGFDGKETRINVSRKHLGGNRTTCLATDKKLTPRFHTETVPFEIEKLNGAWYIPFPIVDRSTLESREEASISEALKDLHLKNNFISPSVGERPRRSGILVLKADVDPTLVVPKVTSKKSKPPAGDKQIYVCCRLVESDRPWQSYLAKPFSQSVGVLTDPQAQRIMRTLNQHKDIDQVQAPSAILFEGNRAKLEVIREFVFPLEYEAASLEPADDIPLKPVTPIKFDLENIGITANITAFLAGENHIKLKLKSTVKEFAGFVNYGQPIFEIRAQAPLKYKPIVASPNYIKMPVLPTRESETEVTIPDGATVAFSMIRSEHTQTVVDSGPLGFKKTKREITTPRYLTVFLNAYIVDPAGIPVN